MDLPQNRTILVVEDERPLLDAIKKKLEHGGCDVVTARSVEQAFDYLQNMPDVAGVWADHYLFGKEDGLVLVAKLKSDNSDYKHIPIFVVSNTASDEKKHAYINLGVNEYFVKSDSRLDEIAAAVIAQTKCCVRT